MSHNDPIRARRIHPQYGKGTDMKTGDVVVAVPPFVLACGSGRYTHAIVESIEPLILVSEEGDMLWRSTIEPGCIRALCQAHPRIVQVALDRLNREYPQPSLLLWPICLFVGHRWFAPDMAHFYGQERNVFECRCDRCGYKTGMLGSEIQRMRKEA